MAFWTIPSSLSMAGATEKVLSREHFDLKDLLDCEDILSQVLAPNDKVIRFLTEPDNILELVRLATAPPLEKNPENGENTSDAPQPTGGDGDSAKTDLSDDESDEEFEDERLRQLRYSKISAEILTTDVWTLLDALLTNEQAMFQLWSMLDKSRPEATTQQLALFTKIVEGLLEKRLDKMLSFITTLPHFVDYFIRYIECQPLVDFLIKVISTDHPESPTYIIDFLYDQHLIPKMIDLLAPGVSHSAQSAAGDFLKAFVNISGGNKSDMCAIGPNELSRQFVGEKCMSQLIDIMLKGGHGMCVAVTVIIEVIRKNNSDYDIVELMETTIRTHPPDPRDNIYLGTMVKLFAKAIPRFQKMFTEPVTTTMQMPFGEIKPLGFERFRICELYAELLHCSNMNLLNDPKGEAVNAERDRERNRVYYPERLLSSESLAELENEDGSDVDNNDTKSATTNDGAEEAGKKTEKEDKATKGKNDSTFIDGDSTLEEETEPLNEHDLDSSEDEPISTVDLGLSSAHAPLNDSPPSSPPPSNINDDSSSSTPSPATPEFDDSDLPEGDRRKMQVSHFRGKQLSDVLEAENKSLRKRRVIGDQLKIALDDNYCIDTVLNMLFEFPWNNFLHNVVFDIVQQVFNGYINHSYNKFLAIHLLTRAKLTERIVYGHNANEEHEKKHNIRLGYVGHLTLISEEVVKFESVFLAESVSPDIVPELKNPAWVAYSQNDLLRLREQYNTVLGRVSMVSEDDVVYEQDNDDDRGTLARELGLMDENDEPVSLLRRRTDTDSDSDSDSDSDADNSDDENSDGENSDDEDEDSNDDDNSDNSVARPPPVAPRPNKKANVEKEDARSEEKYISDYGRHADASEDDENSDSKKEKNVDGDAKQPASKSGSNDAHDFSRYMSQELNSGHFESGSSDDEDDIHVVLSDDWFSVNKGDKNQKNQKTTAKTSKQK